MRPGDQVLCTFVSVRFPPQRYTCRLCEAMLLRSSAILLGAMHLCPGRCTPQGYVPAHRAMLPHPGRYTPQHFVPVQS